MQKRARVISAMVVTLAAVACDSGHGSDSVAVGDTYQGADSDQPGTVTEVEAQGAGCYQIAVEYDPVWQCSEEQIAEAEASPYRYDYYGYYDYGAPPTGTAPVYNNDEPPPSADLDADASLQVKTCSDLAEARRPVVTDAYLAALDENRLRALATNCLGRVSYYSVDENGEENPECFALQSANAAPPSGGSIVLTVDADASSSEGASEYSTTNNQVAGVDEADFVKNDDSTIYVATADGVRVIDAWPPDEAHEVAHLEVPGVARRLFLADDRLVVYTRLDDVQPGREDYAYAQYAGTECTYGYGCRFSSDGGRTMLVVYDVAIPATPVELTRLELSGAFVAARRVGSQVYTVVHDGGLSSVPGVEVTLEADDPEALETEYAALQTEVEDVVASVPDQAFLPWTAQHEPGGTGAGTLTPCDDALAGPAAAGATFLSVVTLDLDTLAAPTRSLIGTKPGFVYASAEALYVAVDGVDGGDLWYHADADTDVSTIHKFRLAGSDTSYVGSRPIRGHVLNQFAMDEHEGVLRVATSSGWVPDPDVASNVTTLAEVDGDLVRLGELNGIAPTEDIRSVRFDGDRGFIVTFVKTDPLFVIDLADPAQPSILGELQIPGFSTYMHRLDENHLLAVGFDADDHDNFAFFDGILIQVFDVTDLTNPQLLHRMVVGTRGSGSEGLTNHLAFNYFAPRQMLALPLTVCEGGDDGVFGQDLTFSGLMTFDISLETGISEHGRMPFVDPPSAAGADCGQWWTDSTSLVKRSIFMDEFIFGISDTTLNAAALADMEDVLSSVQLVD